jgi:hypothetical protein|tara:strand:+ start:454 stop:804 length:351 start_codon:yes stop_codon:yes gene_type:complete
MNNFLYNEKVKTPYGAFSSLDVDEIGVGYEYDKGYSDMDIYAVINNKVYYFILAIPSDYNVAHKDEWDYAREHHSTTEIIDDDLTTEEWVRESITEMDIIDLLLSHKQIETKILEQ